MSSENERVLKVVIDPDEQGRPSTSPVVLNPGESHQFVASVIIVDKNDGRLIVSPTIDNTVKWELRTAHPNGDYLTHDIPHLEAPISSRIGGTLTEDGLYTAPDLVDLDAAVEAKHPQGLLPKLVWAVANGPSDEPGSVEFEKFIDLYLEYIHGVFPGFINLQNPIRLSFLPWSNRMVIVNAPWARPYGRDVTPYPMP